jgi:putative ABC transport system permease protein
MVEFGLALALLAGGGLAIHSLIKLTRVDLGFRTERLLVFNLPAPETRFRDADAMRAFYRRLLGRVEAVPGVTAATVSTGIPGWGTTFGGPFEIVGQPAREGSDQMGAGFNMVSPGYYETFGIRLLHGRPVAVVNETFAKRYLAGLDPLAQRVSLAIPGPGLEGPGPRVAPGLEGPGPRVAWQIVGVTRDVRNGGPRNESFPRSTFRSGRARGPRLRSPCARRLRRNRSSRSWVRSSSRSTRTCPGPTPARWARSSGGSWPAIVSARCSSAASPRRR